MAILFQSVNPVHVFKRPAVQDSPIDGKIKLVDWACTVKRHEAAVVQKENIVGENTARSEGRELYLFNVAIFWGPELPVAQRSIRQKLQRIWVKSESHQLLNFKRGEGGHRRVLVGNWKAVCVSLDERVPAEEEVIDQLS